MTARVVFLVATLLAGAAPSRAQHAGHQLPETALPVPPGPSCAQSAGKAIVIVEAAWPRIETARTADSAGDLLRAVTDLQTVVAAAQAELFRCRAAVVTPLAATPPATMAGMDHSTTNVAPAAAGTKPTTPTAKPTAPMAGMDHSKMTMGPPAAGARLKAPGVKSTAPMAGMDHSKMVMGPPAAVTKPATSPGKETRRAAKPTAPMAGMDHSKMSPRTPPARSETGEARVAPGPAKLPVTMAERIADPACADNVGKAAAPRAVHERKVYYFCSTKARDEFRKDPAAYLKKHPR